MLHDVTGLVGFLPYLALWALPMFGTLLFPQEGETTVLNVFLKQTVAPETVILKLYQNNITPSATDVAGTYTEATFTGYSAITLAAATWTVVAANPSTATHAQQTFTSSANQATQQVYGYYLIGTTSGKLYWAERFSDGPYPISFNNDQIKITPKITLT